MENTCKWRKKRRKKKIRKMDEVEDWRETDEEESKRLEVKTERMQQK
jgi:hypothetical protein